jgi:hypothetical protein
MFSIQEHVMTSQRSFELTMSKIPYGTKITMKIDLSSNTRSNIKSAMIKMTAKAMIILNNQVFRVIFGPNIFRNVDQVRVTTIMPFGGNDEIIFYLLRSSKKL